MPELPEVETIRRGLLPRLTGAVIRGVDVRSAKQFFGDADSLVGRKIIGLERFGKLIVLRLDDARSLTIHLKMTGQLLWKGNEAAVMGGHPSAGYLVGLPHRHTRIVVELSDGATLFFNDLRTFGYMSVVGAGELDQPRFVSSLGPEPLEEAFTAEFLAARLKKRPKSVIKSFLLDQTNIAGLGNIYADESLFRARILPNRLSGSLSADESEALHAAIRETLALALEYGGSSERDYVNAIGEKGTYLKIANVYRRTGLPCTRNDGGTVTRIKIGGRSSHFCPLCQQ
jgi:formamidopyrimidine-DNA glycosylase